MPDLRITAIQEETESEASGSARVTPVQQRRRQVPTKHPHRRGRKVSAPPELQPHLGPYNVHNKKHAQGGAITDSTDSPHSEYIINISPGNNFSDGLYSGSDSGVTSEYSSWAIPVNGHVRQDQSQYEDDLTPPGGSVEDLVNENSKRQKDKYNFTSDSESESTGMNSPLSSRRRGMDNAAYVNTEPRALVLAVDGPPPLNRSMTDTNLLGTHSNVISSYTGSAAQASSLPRNRKNSMVVQLNLGNQIETIQGSSASTLPGGRSVSLVSLNQAGISTTPNANNYPNLSQFGSDNQSIYSEIGTQYNTGYLGSAHLANVMGSQGSLNGLKDHSLGVVSSAPMPDAEDHESEPTSEEEKKAWTIETLADNLSLIYAIFLVTLGTVIYLADTFSGHDSAFAESFNIFLIVVQLAWLIYAHIDVRHYIQTIMKAMEEARERNQGKSEEVVLEPTGDGQYQLRINLPEPRKTIPQHYGFTSGRHGGSLYLKIGATVFCFGHLIHSGLNLGQKILYLTADDPAFENCTCTPDVVMSVLQPIYAFYNLFFVFKYSNLIINRRKLLSRFGLMHCIAASLCFWIYTIMQETLQAIASKHYDTDYANASAYSSTQAPLAMPSFKKAEKDSDEDDDDDEEPMKKIQKALYTGTTVSPSWSINYGCEKSTELTEMINYTTPYLYPFSIEYNILIVGVWILILENVGKTERHTHIPSVEVTYEEDNTKGFSSNMIIYVDCHSSNRGLFAGLLLTVATVISIILFFIFTSSQNNVMLGLYVNAYSALMILLVMTIATAFAYHAIRNLDIIKHHISNVDDILLIICLPCILLFAFFSLVPSVLNGSVLFAAVNIMQVIQTVLQTVLIGDGLRRCSNSSSLQQKKPGREVVTFLVVANVALWLLETFEIKSDAGNADKYAFYGKNLWTLLSHLTLPLALFYRFHSSVCLADMWKASYEPESEH
ncbi:proton channel OtopLc isoform X2 [Hyalella azteca]|uniref:Proton channel OtopLc isoform X2 n=1 Tax=Hyalella azteca TaxID=294128 RepID=A0A8B7PPM5_HYAAZ|nr:proton channel OtopLc isoform X2 [Hyalella azteca]